MIRMIEWIVSSSALLAVLIVLRQIWKGRISLRLQYALWCLALVRLLIPFSFGSTAFSVANALPEEIPEIVVTGGHATIKTDTEEREYDFPAQISEYKSDSAALSHNGGTGEFRSATIYEEHWHPKETLRFLRLIWYAGMAAVALCLLGSNLHFGRKLRRNRELLTDGEALRVYLTDAADTPCLFGLFRPAIYVTPDAAEEPDRLRHVIEHELTHCRHGDQVWSLLRALCLVLHWYNPLVWWAAFLSRRDGELACDEATIARLGEVERAAYGRTLIDMTCRKRPALLVTATTMTGGKGSIRERIALIAKKPRTILAALIVLLIIAAAAVGCTFTGAKAKETPEPTESPAAATPSPAHSPEPTALPEDATLYERFFALANPNDLTWTLTDAGGRQISGSWVETPFPIPPVEGYAWTEKEFHTSEDSVDPGFNVSFSYQWELTIADEMRNASVTFYGDSREPMNLIKCTDGEDGCFYEYEMAHVEPSFDPTFTDAATEARQAVTLEAEKPRRCFLLQTDSADPETVAAEYAAAYVQQFTETLIGNPFAANDVVSEERVMEVREDGDAFIFQSHLGFKPTRRARFESVMGGENLVWNEQQGRFYVWQYFCLEKVDGGWRGVDLDVLEDYSEYTAVYGDYFASVPNPRADAAIREAAIAFNKDSHTEGEISCESHVLVAKESTPGSGGNTVETYYLMILYQAYDWVDGAPKAVSGSYIPSALTFEVSPEGEYTLLEYWIPRDSPFYWDDLRAKFPDYVPDEDLNDQNPKYLERVMADCEAQARAYFAAAGEPTDEWFIETARPLAEDFGWENGQYLRPGATISRGTDGASAEVVFPCLGKRYSISVSFRRGEEGWAPLTANAVQMMEDTDRGYAQLTLDLKGLTVPEPVAEYAMEVAQQELDYYERSCGYVFDDARITAITHIDTGTVGNYEGCELYRLEWRFRPAADQGIMLLGGMAMEYGRLTEWSSAGQPFILMGWQQSNGADSWERICVTNTDEIETEYGTPEMIERYGNAYTAAAMGLRAKARGEQSLLDARHFSIFSPSSSPQGVGEDWARAFAQRLTQAPEDDPCCCRSVEVRSCEFYAESLLSEPRQFLYFMEFAAEPADMEAFQSCLEYWHPDGENADRLRFTWMVLLEAGPNGWECVSAGSETYGGWGWLNDYWNANELLDRMVTEQVGGEDALMLLPLIDWADFDRQYKFGEETWNALWRKLNEACVGEGRYVNRGQNLLWSDVYPDDQLYRDLYLMLGFLHSDGAYAEGLGELLKKQYIYDPVSFEQSLQYLPEAQRQPIRVVLEEDWYIQNGFQLRFYGADGELVPDGGWYHLTEEDEIVVRWSGEVPLGVRLLFTPAGTGTYDETELLVQRTVLEEDMKRGEIRFPVSEVDTLKRYGMYGQLHAELDYVSVIRPSHYYNVYYDAISLKVDSYLRLGRVGDSAVIGRAVEPAEAEGSIRWVSLDPSVAEVDEQGTVTAVSLGRTVIRATVGSYVRECFVRVVGRAKDPEAEDSGAVTAKVSFYSAPTREWTSPEVRETLRFRSDRAGEEEIIDALKGFIDGISSRSWQDDDLVDRTPFYYDGDLEFSDRECVYFFSLDTGMIYYDHYFAQLPKETVEYLKSMGQ